VDVEANWSMIAENVALPFAPSGILTEFLGANNTAVIKQDDVDLINYPLDYSSENYTRADKLTSLDYVSTCIDLLSKNILMENSMLSSNLPMDLQ
jgi:hypothetical protein